MSIQITQTLVEQLIAQQFPHWADLPVRAVLPGGWDHRTFRLGDELLVRLPSDEAYAAQVSREQRWLPWLAERLRVRIPEPLAMGAPAFGYPGTWSVYRWVSGETAASSPALDLVSLACDLGAFLTHLHRLDANTGPPSGPENGFRGGALTVYDAQARCAISALAATHDHAALLAMWEQGIASHWNAPAVWVHGDVSPGNLLVQNDRLVGVIDFGLMCVGDPACDLAIAWTFFDAASRKTFRDRVSLDGKTWERGRAWALWKAAIVVAGHCETNADETVRAQRALDEILLR
jgi:aminoglycoside phosphotransferase (APT) family kinase protein